MVTDRVQAIRARSVIAAMDEHRRRWMVAMLERENRIADAATIGNLMQSTSFLATTCARGRKCLRYRGFSPASPFSAVTRHTHPRALCPAA